MDPTTVIPTADTEREVVTWQWVWEHGVAPQLDVYELAVLRDGLAADDRRILQGHTCDPMPLSAVMDWPCRAADPLGYPTLVLRSGATVREVEERFYQLCTTACDRLGDPAGIRPLLNAVDSWSRPEMLANLLAAVDAELARRSDVPGRPGHAVQTGGG